MSSIRTPLHTSRRWPRRRALATLLMMISAWVVSRVYLAATRHETERLKAAAASVRLASEGTRLAESRRWLEAVEALDAAIRAGETAPRVYRALAISLGELGWIDDAAAAYETEIRLEPADIDPYISLATAHRSVGRYALALRALQRAERQ